MRRQLVWALICGSLVGLLRGAGFAQSSGAPECEVATVKPSPIDDARMRELAAAGNVVRQGRRITGDTAEYIYMSLGALVVEAYQLPSSQVTGPNWIWSGHFDVTCKMPEGSKRADAPAMLQSLLAERFKLAAHPAAREELVSALIVGKGGVKMRSTEEFLNAGGSTGALPEGQAQRTSDGRGGGGVSYGRLSVNITNDGAGGVHMAGSMAMATLAAMLNDFGLGNGHPVVDMTGLEGYYQVSLDIPPGMTLGGPSMAIADGPGASQNGNPAEAASEPGGGSLRRSLLNLGLDLENRKAPVKRLIIDHAEKMPTEN